MRKLNEFTKESLRLMCGQLQALLKKQQEQDRKKAEVRKRLEEAAAAKKSKKGFMTPERKKKLRVSFLFKKNFFRERNN